MKDKVSLKEKPPLKVLVVDDQPEVLDEIVRSLRAEEGAAGRPFDITPEVSHESAVARVEVDNFDVVVVDMYTPDNPEKGLDVVRALTSRSAITIVYTARGSYRNCVRAIRAGAWDYLEKMPTDRRSPIRSLVESIEEGVEERKGSPQGVSVDENAKWVWNNMPMLLERYPGQVVAILYGGVVAHAPDYDTVAKEVAHRFQLQRPYVLAIPDPNIDAVE